MLPIGPRVCRSPGVYAQLTCFTLASHQSFPQVDLATYHPERPARGNSTGDRPRTAWIALKQPKRHALLPRYTTGLTPKRSPQIANIGSKGRRSGFQSKDALRTRSK